MTEEKKSKFPPVGTVPVPDGFKIPESPVAAPQTPTSDPEVQFTIRCPKSVHERFKALCVDPNTGFKATYGQILALMVTAREEGQGK